MRAYHFVGDTLLDGRPIPADGEWLVHEGPVEMCHSGLHASLDPLDALMYAHGPTLCLVDVEGVVERGDDKLVARARRIVQRIDATALLREFSRWCALLVAHLWSAPPVVREYLETGRDDLRCTAAAVAAWSGVGAAGGDVVRAAALAARATAWAAVRAAVRATAWAAEDVGDAVRAAQRKKFAEMVDEAFRCVA